ncbi:MAG: WD40 repeat domain-containing serine/threonine-protein kinase, partial [Candidatus Eisenbacteria bacterium]
KTGAAAMRVPGHEIIEEIARGGMGVVYRARENETHRTVALKMLRPRFADETGMRERFRLEARAVAALEHPSILPVYRVDEAGDMPFFTMKFAGGGTLAARRDSLRGQWREITGLLLAMTDAVQYAHQHGVLHRDLKPANVLFDDAGKPYLSDFGLVKLVDAVDPLSGSQNFLGTPHYASPEVASANAGAATVASDVWSLGAMLYELLAGHTPFDAPGIPALLRKIVEDHAPALPRDVPRNLAIICQKCLTKSPDARYASAAALADDLRRWLDGRPILARPANSAERLWQWAARNPAPAALTAALLAALVILGFSIVRESRANAAALLVSRDAERASRETEAAALLAEARATRRANDITRRDEALAAVRRSAALHPTAAARDELVSLLALPAISQTSAIPYTRWNPRPDGNLTRYVILDKDACSIRDFHTHREIARVPRLPRPNFPPGPLSPDGKLLVLRAVGGTEIWDIARAALLVTLPPITGVNSFSGEGRWVSLAVDPGQPGPSVLCDLHVTPPAVRPVAALPEGWSLRALSPDGTRAVAWNSSTAPGLSLVDTATLTVLREYAAEQTGVIMFVLWNADSRSFLTGSLTGVAARWQLDASAPQWSIPAHEGRLHSMALTHGDRIMATQGQDGLVKFWDLTTLAPRGSLPWPGLALYASRDGSVLLAHRRDAAQSGVLSCAPSSVCEMSALPSTWAKNVYFPGTPHVSAAPDSTGFMVTGGHDLHTFAAADAGLTRSVATGVMEACAPDALTGGCIVRRMTELSWLPAPDAAAIPLGTTDAAAVLAFDPHSRRVLIGGKAGVRAWHLPGGQAVVTSLDRLSKSVVGISGNPGLGLSKSVVQYFAPAELKAASLGLDRAAAVSALAWSPTGRLIAWAGTARDKQKGAWIVDAGTARDVTAFLPGESITQLRFSAGETTCLAATARELVCCDTITGAVRWRIPHQRTGRDPICFAAAASSPRLAAALAPDSISLLDPASGSVFLTLTHPVTRTIRALDLSPDGTRLCA